MSLTDATQTLLSTVRGAKPLIPPPLYAQLLTAANAVHETQSDLQARLSALDTFQDELRVMLANAKAQAPTPAEARRTKEIQVRRASCAHSSFAVNLCHECSLPSLSLPAPLVNTRRARAGETRVHDDLLEEDQGARAR